MTTLKDYIRDLAIDAYKKGYKNAGGLEIAELSQDETEQVDELVDETIEIVSSRLIGQD